MRRLPTLLIAAIVATVFISQPANAQRRAAYKVQQDSFLNSFRPVVESSHRSVVRFERFDEHDDVWIDAALGVVVDPSGLVVTKSSELLGTLRASLALHRNLEATVVGRDKRNDLALVRLGLPGEFADQPLESIVWAEQTTEVGRWVVTPDIDRVPAAVGVVSVPKRTIPPSKERAVLGITMVQQPGRPVVESVNRDSAADRAGIVVDDVIERIDGNRVDSRRSLIQLMLQRRPGDVVQVDVIRDGTSLSFSSTLQHVPPVNDDPDDQWNDQRFRSRWAMMNELGSRLSIRRDNFPTAIQHDTVLRPEDCGGAALNLKGEAVGINIARSGRTESLLVPANVVQDVVAKLSRDAQTRWTSTEAASK